MPSIPTLADLERKFWGAFGGAYTVDAKYAALKEFALEGITWADVLEGGSGSQTFLFDADGSYLYCGVGPGTGDTTTANWRITRVELAEDQSLAGTATATDVAWDDRTTVEYS